ncbi:hypothetical protein [Klebsiella oxytoca]|nr:hypothetical protein [Klebsiella oxytoca]EUC90081.1 hypothetical protein HMPREF1569_2264 [Klebsiella oxytoca OK-1]
MTTDITELAQREKFEAWAEEVGALPWGILKKHRNQDGSYPGPHYTYMWKAWQAGGAELLEALEKAKGMETYWKTQCRGITDHCEELQARIAELESHTVKPPVHPTVASENLDDETLQELIEFRRTTFEYHSKEGNKVQTIIHGVTLAALRELQERRKADSEPVAWTEKCEITNMQATGLYLRGFPDNSHGRDIPLYRHAQQPVVPPMQHWAELCREHPDMSIGDAIIRAAWWNHCRAAMLQAQSDDDGEPTDDERIMAIEGIIPPISAGNSPLIPEGYVMVPKKLTAENGAKAALLGEFNLEYTLTCHECFGGGCDDCSGEGTWTNTIPIDWTTIKAIWAKAVEHFVATPAGGEVMSRDEMIAKAYLDKDFLNWFECYFGYGPKDEVPCNHPVLVATALAWVESRKFISEQSNG